MFSTPFWHHAFPKTPDSISSLEQSIELTESKKQNEINELRAKYDNSLITAENYISQNDRLLLQLIDLQESNKQLLNKEAESVRVFFWKSPRSFMVAFGIRFPVVLLSFIFTLLVVNHKHYDKFTKAALDFTMVSAWSLSTYLMLYVFWNAQDYPLDVYRYTFLALSVFVGTSIVYFFKSYEFGVNKLKEKIRFTMDRMMEALNLVNNKEEYLTKIINPTLDKLDE